MKRTFMTILILAILVAQNINGQVSTKGDNTPLEAEIGKILRDFFDAISRRDAAETIKFFADNGFFYSFESGYSTGTQTKEEYRTYLQSPMLANSKDSFEIKDLKVISIGSEMAAANYTLITKSEENGKTEVRRDHTTNVFVRRDGHWQILIDHTSRLPNPLEPTVSGMPVSWIRTPANSSNGYSMTVDTNIKHGGKASTVIKYMCGEENDFGSLAQSIAADEYLDKRVQFSGWLKTENADAVGLWMRVDGNQQTLGFDNMMNRPVKGTIDWKYYEVVLDVPAEAVNIFFGTLISGRGQVWVDDLKMEIIGSNVPTTNLLSPQQMQIKDPTRMPKKSERKQPLNLGFENGTIP